MPTVTVRVPLTANASNNNVLAGSIYEYLPFAALAEIGILADATGVLASINSGPDTLAEEQPVQIGTINTFPRYPDDFYYSDEAAPGDRLKIAVRDTSGAARVVMVVARINPI